MEITLNHTIVFCQNKEDSARFYEKILGFKFLKVWGHFAVVKVNSTLTFDFMEKEAFTKQHYAFKVSDKEFDLIYKRIKDEELIYGSGPYSRNNFKINHDFNGRGLYFDDLDGHILEILTSDYIID